MSETSPLLIGVDGGATEAKAHAATCDDLARPTSLALRSESAARRYERLPRFEPVPIPDQLAQRNSGQLSIGDDERRQGELYVEGAAQAIRETVTQCGDAPILVGMGMPGLKTPDGRGINAINNGPRVPDYLDRLERRLADLGVKLVAPIACLGSDADYCGLGEEHAADGLFRDVANAYYLGGGTGLADAMKLRGSLVRFDDAREWMLKSWQLPSALGPTFEKLVSAKSLNEVYARWRGCDPMAGTLSYPETAAAAGDPVAIEWLGAAAAIIAELIVERIVTIHSGRQSSAHRGDAYAALKADHPFRGTILKRVILGQQVGRIYGDQKYRRFFGDPLDTSVAALIAASDDVELTRALLIGGKLLPGFMRASRLRAAPALGAAVAAVLAYKGK
jgi:predicted NBD/HSP70 family sugar kinase